MLLTRAAIVSFLLGLGIGGAQYYTLHQDVWKSTESMLHLFPRNSNLVTREEEDNLSEQTKETMESHLRNKAISWWNGSVDELKDRLVRLPDSFQQLVEDTKASVQKVTGGFKSSK